MLQNAEEGEDLKDRSVAGVDPKEDINCVLVEVLPLSSILVM